MSRVASAIGRGFAFIRDPFAADSSGSAHCGSFAAGEVSARSVHAVAIAPRGAFAAVSRARNQPEVTRPQQIIDASAQLRADLHARRVALQEQLCAVAEDQRKLDFTRARVAAEDFVEVGDNVFRTRGLVNSDADSAA